MENFGKPNVGKRVEAKVSEETKEYRKVLADELREVCEVSPRAAEALLEKERESEAYQKAREEVVAKRKESIQIKNEIDELREAGFREKLRKKQREFGKEFLEVEFSFTEWIEGLKNTIYTTTRLSDSEILVMGIETRIFDTKMKTFGEQIKGFGGAIHTAIKLSDSEILVMGGTMGDGVARILNTKTKTFGKRIKGIRSEINTATKLSDTEILVMGGNGRFGETRIFDIKTKTFGKEIGGFRFNILTSLKISDTEILVAGKWGEIRIFNTKTKTFGEQIKGFGGDYIYTATKLSDSEILVMGGDGKAGILSIKRS